MRALAALSRFVGNTIAQWVLVFAVLAFLMPQWFIALKVAIVPLLGLVMFGMGLTLKLDDFAALARQPWRVALGVVAHFMIMPGMAWLLASDCAVDRSAAARNSRQWRGPRCRTTSFAARSSARASSCSTAPSSTSGLDRAAAEPAASSSSAARALAWACINARSLAAL